VKRLFRATLSKNLKSNKMPSSKHSSTNWTLRRSRDRLKSSKMKNSRERLLWPREKDKMRKFSQELELPSSKSSKKKKLLRSLRLKEWSKSSLPLRLFKRPRLLPQRRLPPRPTSLDSKESMSSQEERLRLNSKCSRSSSRWRPSRLSNSKNKDSWRISPTLSNKNNSPRFNKLRPTCRLSRMPLPRPRRKLPIGRSLRRIRLLCRKLLKRKQRSRNRRNKKKLRRMPRKLKSPSKSKRRQTRLDSCNSKNKRLKNKRNKRK